MGSTSGFTDFTCRLGFICCCWRLSLQPEGEGLESFHFPGPAWSLDAWEYIGASQSCLWSSISKLPATLLFALTCIMALGSWVQPAERCGRWAGGSFGQTPALLNGASHHLCPVIMLQEYRLFQGATSADTTVSVSGDGAFTKPAVPMLPVPDPGSLMLMISSLVGNFRLVLGTVSLVL